ncbi:murein biosynthesis integral membrane protein MurJ, partial [candidate division WWE3 bacterium RIFOXYD1_FULL_39_9]
MKVKCKAKMGINNTKNKLTAFLMDTQNTILSAALVLAISSGINAVLGVVKNRFFASEFGVSQELAVFYTADKIPNLVYSILIVGAISTVFIPVFTDLLKKDKQKAFETASTIINTTFVFFLVISTFIFIYAEPIINLLALGKFPSSDVTLGANLMRVMLISQMILVTGSLITSVLQSFKYFIAPAIAPVAYNIGMIIGILFLSDKYGIYGPAYGTILGATFHLLIQLPYIKRTGFVQSMSFNFHAKGLKEMSRLIPPRLVSVLISNLLGTVNNSLAILISTSSVIFLKFAIQLQSFPIMLFGASIATASLPTLSAENDEKDREKFKKTFITSFHQMMYLVLPLSVILMILRIPVVRLVYGVSNFPWEATVKTAYVLAFFSFSVFSQSANYLITRAFYALKDTTTPVKISAATILLNVGMSLLFVLGFGWGVWSVAFSFSVTSLIDMVLLMYMLSRKLGGFRPETILVPFTKISYASVLMGIGLYVPLKLLDRVVFDTSRTLNLFVLTAVAGI